ncbi:DUF4272 domain-containing protein [Sandaracinobacteroides saxicola]|uniref:DUF4272 domain-containing protein n=1 Tax=Sandaracinobacteroides saxicola TaxID=2759707 RepID=A0A7G5IK66_9SPHN|nr:DUF4272 domain-containing protein [Sandaracinobacteroides saxicola]QMW23758.1 DUF4272 domain-containing protein [Sandaracinobacteroides saxicola]
MPGDRGALERKERSEALLLRLDIPINPDLPIVENSNEIRLRDGKEVIRRAMCLFAVSYAALESVAGAQSLLERWSLTEHLSPKERAFLSSATPSHHDRVQFSWRCEAMVPLMWATGLMEELSFPTEDFNFEYLSDFWKTIPHGFWEGVGTRSADEILDEVDLIYRLHWAVREAQLSEMPVPGGLDEGVVMERHHALNWLIGYGECDWDDVTTDT